VKPDLIVKLLIGAALVALTAWIAMHTYWDEIGVPTPMTGEAATNPYYSVEHLAGSLGMHTHQIKSLGALPTDAVVLVNDLDDELVHEKIESLENWVESGGRLIVSGDTLWSSKPLQAWSGVRPQTKAGIRAPLAAPDRLRAALDPQGNCTALVLQVDGSPTGQSLTVCAATPMSFVSHRQPAWMLSDSSGTHVLRVAIGDGEFSVLGTRGMLNNKNLLLGDHAEVLIRAAHLERGDTLLILSRSEGEPLPALLWRLAAPAILFLAAAVVLLIVRYLPRFGPPIPVTPPIRRSLAEQIRANARFAWRTRKLGSLRGAFRRSLDEAAKRQIGGYGSLNVRQQSDALAASTGIDAAAINAALTADGSGNMNEHRASITLLEVCRRILTDPTTKRSPHER
jgi:hypothetical protein